MSTSRNPRGLRLTDTEISVILAMEGIATAGAGDGDYGPWTDAEWKALSNLADKCAVELRRRKEAA